MSSASTKQIQSFYDDEAGRYFDTRYVGDSADSLVWRARADIVLELTGQVDGLVVDLGCGPGVLAPRLVRQVSRLISADLSLEMLRVGRSNLGDAGRAHWVNCDMTHLPFATGSVDTLLVIGVFGIAPDPVGALREFGRVVRDGGRLIVQTPNALNPRRVLERFTQRLRWNRPAAYEDRLSQHSIGPKPLSTAGFEHMVRQAGFAPARRRYYDFRLPYLSRVSARWDGRTTEVLHRALSRRRRAGQLGEGLVLEAVRRGGGAA